MRFIFLVLMGTIAMTAARRARAADMPAPDRLPVIKELPDPLTTFDGRKVTTRTQWLRERRPELKALFQHYMYGQMPNVPVRVRDEVVHEDRAAFGGKGTLREIKLTVANGCPPIYLLLATPNDAKGRLPAFVGMNFSGNHTLVSDPKIHIPDCWMYPNYPGVKNNRATEAGRGKLPDVWAIDQAIARGYALATFYDGDVDPDDKEHRGGMRPYLSSRGVETATIMAWAWGIMRAVDYLSTRPEIDSARIAVVGHSRLGKTALVAAAFDERIALAIPHQSGTGGAAPSRSKSAKAESVQRINTGFPQWFNDNFKKFNNQVERLPFDQNCLTALVAPRPVLFTNAVEDQWANPDGQFEVLKAAEPVYKLLGTGGCDADKPPAPGKLVNSTLGYYIRPGQHSMTRDDWRVFLEFADKHLKK